MSISDNAAQLVVDIVWYILVKLPLQIDKKTPELTLVTGEKWQKPLSERSENSSYASVRHQGVMDFDRTVLDKYS